MTPSWPVHPLYVDGPLKGQDRRIHTMRDLVIADPRAGQVSMWPGGVAVDTVPTVTYRFTELSILGVVLVVGSIRADKPTPGDLFDALLSPEARRAAYRYDEKPGDV